MADLSNLTVIGLEVENVMRVAVVRLAPSPSGLVEVSGANGNGKTSLLNAIEMAIGGERAIPWEPIRKGEERAVIRIDLGDDGEHRLRITRTFKARPDADPPYTTTLKVEQADGSRPKGEQTLLKALVHGLSFDPQQFMTAKPDDRVETIKSLVHGFDFAANEAECERIYQRRTGLNRDVARMQGVIDSIAVPLDTPTELIDTAALVAELNAIGEGVRTFEREMAQRRDAGAQLQRNMERVAELDRQASDLETRARALRVEAHSLQHVVAQETEALERLPPVKPPPKGDEIAAKIAEADKTNDRVRLLQRKRLAEAELEEAREASAAATKAIEAIDLAAVQAIERADLPSHLSIVAGRVMLRGVPFEQASTAQQLRTSMALGMHANPKLKVMRIRQGAMLDDEAWAIVRAAAIETGFQIWIETIRPHEPDAIIMVEGKSSA